MEPLLEATRFDPLKELPDFRKFAELNTGRSLGAYAWMELSPDLFIATVSLLSPKFMLHRDALVFSEGFSEARFEEWNQHFKGDLSQIEQMVNHKHARGLLQFNSSHSLRTETFVAELFAKFWRLAVAEQFPDISVKIEVIDDPEENDCVITVERIR